MKTDFSAFALFTAGFAALTGAVHVPRQEPSGNPTSAPATGEGVLAGSPFQITWQPTTPGPVQIFLCVGPSINCVNQPAPLPGAESIANSGTFLWTPSTALLPTNGQGYGIFIKDLTTNQFQFSPQFGIVNPNAGSTIIVSQVSSIPPVPTVEPVTVVTVPSVPSAVITAIPTGTGSAIVPIVQPSAPLSVPTSLVAHPTAHPNPSAPAFTPPPSNGAVKVGGSMAAIFGLVLAALAL